MSWTDILRFWVAMLTSLGGGVGIVFAFSRYLGKVWADRALERERHKYAALLQDAKSELDKAANRYQVGLDSLKLVHTLRTTEEFSRLGSLWRHMAILQDALKGATSFGVRIMPAEPTARDKYLEALRVGCEKALIEARNFFLQEKLFIPAKIANCAERTLGAAIKERNFYDIFAQHHEAGVRSQYTQNLPSFLDEFDAGMHELERLTRAHIEGEKLDSSSPSITSDSQR